MMNAYGFDLSVLDFETSSQLLDSFQTFSPNSVASSSPKHRSPPKHRHDGTSPLPLSMDWSPPPSNWDGVGTVWPHDPCTGWSYCVTIPSWSHMPNSRDSAPTVFYRVQVGIQTPEAITATRGILHRFSDFLKLFAELKKLFPDKNIPVPPSKRLLRTKSSTMVEERRFSLESWMGKLLSNIDISRSAPVAIFLELEAAARLAFHCSSENDISSSPMHPQCSDISVAADGSSAASGDGTGYENGKAILTEEEDDKLSSLSRKVSLDTEVHSPKNSEISTYKTSITYGEGGFSFSEDDEKSTIEDMLLHSNTIVALSTEQRHKFNRVLVSLHQRLATAKSDVEDLVSRLNQELTVRQYLTTKVKDLELELETTQESTKENLQQAVSIEKERSTQLQWDLEDFRKKYLEMEMKLKTEQDERARMESINFGVVQENEMLAQELIATREQRQQLQKHHEESEKKSKTDVKVLVKEVKGLRSSQSELKQELSKLMTERQEMERFLQKEKQRRESVSSLDEKLLHECANLQKRLSECSVNFKVEAEDKLILDASTPSDTLDLLAISDNRIGLLLAEAQLLVQDVENSVAKEDRTTEDELRKMLTDIFIDSASARKQINSVMRCALDVQAKLKKGEKEDEEEEETPLRDTVLGKFL